MISPFSLRANRSAEPAPNLEVKPEQERSRSLWSNDDMNWWMITLSDLTLLLLGFMVAWYTIEKRTHVVQQPVAAAKSAATEPVTRVTPKDDVGNPDDWKTFQEEMERFIEEAGLAKDVSVESTHKDLVVSLRDTVPFASGKAELRAQSLPVLEKVVSMVLSHPHIFLEISGHTDGIPIATGVFPSNWELSAARASRVARYLIEKGIHPSRIAVQGYANQRPKVPDSNFRNRRANRRVEIRLYYGANGEDPR
jgi:chemotaxis protein MotB